MNRTFADYFEDLLNVDAPNIFRIEFDSNTEQSNDDEVEIKRVIFNEPATIVFWTDGTKTVVKSAPKEKFDKEKGLAMAISKKAFGNTGAYWTDFEDGDQLQIIINGVVYLTDTTRAVLVKH